MDIIINFLHKVVHYAAEIGVAMLELTSIFILLHHCFMGVKRYIQKDEHTRLKLAYGIALSLEFKLGGEVLRTLIVRDWTEMMLLGAIVVLCAAVTLMLHFEIKVEEEKLKMQIQEAEVLHHEIDITE